MKSFGKLGQMVIEFKCTSFDSRLLTAPDGARILNISKGGAYQLIQQKKIPSVRFNSYVRVRKTSTNWPPNAQSRYSASLRRNLNQFWTRSLSSFPLLSPPEAHISRICVHSQKWIGFEDGLISGNIQNP